MRRCIINSDHPELTAGEVNGLALATSPAIQTKLRPPRLRDGHLSRPRLLAQLDGGLDSDLILIAAPAGYGKTSLAADWLNQMPAANGQPSELHVAWLSLDENDNDLAVFLQYVIAAIQRAFPEARPCAQTRSLLDARQSLPQEVITHNLINDLAVLPGPLLLALDDYHLITDPACRQMMEQLVRYLPLTLRLLLITRIDPALPLLASLRAQQRITEIRAVDLRFQTAEAHAVLEHTSGTSISPETAVTLETQTEGWIIGLQMAGISLRGKADQAAFAHAFATRGNRLVMDYLLDEVLARQTKPVLDFLLQSSILEKFNARLCEAVTNLPGGSHLDGERYLEGLAQGNLFLVALDEDGEWYRYHHLFQNLLRRRLVAEWEPEAIGELHRRAGVWLAGQGLVEEALRHLLAASDIEAAVALIESNRHKALNREDFRTLERWLGMLPEDVVATRPSFMQLKAWVLRLRFKLEEIPPLMQQVESLLEIETRAAAGSQGPAALRGERDALWSELFFWAGDFERSLAAAQSALDRLPADHFFPRGLAALYQCQSLQATGQLERAINLMNTTLADERLQHLAFRIRMLIAAAGVYCAAGELQHMKEACHVLLKLGQSEQRPISTGWGHYGLGLVCYHWNRLDEARIHWSAVAELRYLIHFRAYHEAMLGLALVQQLQGDVEDAQQTMDSLSQALLEMNQNSFIAEVDAFRARLALLRGDVHAAGRWAETAMESRRLPTWYWETSDITRIKVYLAQGTAASLQKAAVLLQDSQQAAEAAHQTEQLIEIWALSALVAAAQARTEEALAASRQAVALAEPGGFVRIFVELGPEMADVLRQLARQSGSLPFIFRILAAFPDDQAPILTEREQEILAYLQQGLPNKEIAERLVVSLNTVKKHNRNIYEKLGVHGRQQAIDQARTRGLLP